jgi:hypothetical protein
VGATIQDTIGPSKLAPQPQFPETFNAKLRTGWRDARETTEETSTGVDSNFNIDLLLY